jgi:hypothetical protein
MAGEDLALEVVIRALLDAKGFEAAQANVKQLAGAANQAKAPLEDAGKSGKKLGESFGGSRGPVADLTRVLLINIGASRGAGEAAKFAGAGLTAMEVGAAGATLPLIALTAGIALLLPKLVEWFSKTEDQTGEQATLKQEIKDTLPMLERYAATVKKINEAAALQLNAGRAKALREESLELKHVQDDVEVLGEILRRHQAAGEHVWPQEVEQVQKLRGRLMDLQEAQRQGITVEELYTQRIKDDADAQKAAAAAAKAHMDALDDLLERQQRQAQEQLDAVGAAQDFAEKQSKDAGDDAKEFARKQAVEYRKRLKAEGEYQLDIAKLKLSQKEVDAQLAAAETAHTAAMIGNAGAALGALGSIFGRNRALSIAGAIADTYAAGLQVFRDPFFIGRPWERGIAMAATIGQGLATVSAMRDKSNIGFDDPFSDIVARQLGRRSAQDFVKYFGGEFLNGMIGFGQQVQNVTTNRTTVHRGNNVDMRGMTINGVVGNKMAVLRAIERVNRRADRVRRRTTIGE